MLILFHQSCGIDKPKLLVATLTVRQIYFIVKATQNIYIMVQPGDF